MVKVKVNELEFEEPLVESYTINSNQIVSEFHKTIQFSNTGKQNISIQTTTNFKQIRIIPHFKNPIGSGKSKVAGFGTGGWIGLMFWDYYDFVRDETLLADKVYPVIYEQANFASRIVQNFDGYLLAKPSSSPEQKIRDTIGTTFDQQMSSQHFESCESP